MQIRTDDQSTDITKPGLGVEQHRQLGRCCGFDSELLGWGVSPEIQTQVIKEIEDISSEDLYEVIAEAYANVEDEAQPQSSEDGSTDEALPPVVDEVAEHDDGRTSVQCDVPSMGASGGEVQEEQDNSTSVSVGDNTGDIHFIKVNWI